MEVEICRDHYAIFVGGSLRWAKWILVLIKRDQYAIVVGASLRSAKFRGAIDAFLDAPRSAGRNEYWWKFGEIITLLLYARRSARRKLEAQLTHCCTRLAPLGETNTGGNLERSLRNFCTGLAPLGEMDTGGNLERSFRNFCRRLASLGEMDTGGNLERSLRHCCRRLAPVGEI
jgi:hypothetical protein